MGRIFLLSLTAGALFVPSFAQASALEFFFPSLKKKEENPYETLRAPFAEENGAADALDQLPINAIPLSEPHRITSEMADWVMGAVSDSMNLDGQGYRAMLEENKPSFDAAGYQQYLAFLQKNNVLKVLETGKFHVRSYVENTPLLLNEGAVNDHYRWLYQVPLVVSYIDKNAKGYRGVEPTNQRVTLNVQIGRSVAAKNPQGVLIESWSGRVTAFDN